MLSIIDECKIIKKLGSGMFGTTYLVTYKNKKYALKIEHILETDVKKNMSSPTWREINFANTMGKKYPNHFLTLFDYDIIDTCEHTQKYSMDIKNVPKQFQTIIKNLAKSSYCSRKLYSLIDITLQQILNKLTKDQIYSILIQVTNAVYLMHKAGYTHCDLHPGNIGLIKTSNPYIKIFGNNIPTHGYICQIIDYGDVLHKKFSLKKDLAGDDETKRYNRCLKLEAIWIFVNMSSIMNCWNKINFNKINAEKLVDKFVKSDYYDPISKLMQTKNKYNKYYLFQLLFPKEFQLNYLKLKKIVPNKILVDFNDIIYVLGLNEDNAEITLLNYYKYKLIGC